MPTEQEVTVEIEDGREYPSILFSGRLDIDVLKDQLAQDGLMLTQLDGKPPNCDRNGLSRTMFTAAIIKAQTTRHPGEASSPPLSVHARSHALQCCPISVWQYCCIAV